MINNFLRGNSRNTKYVLGTQLLMGVFSFFYFLTIGNYTAIFVSFGLYFVLMHFLHNVSLHRYFSHNSFKTNKFWHITMCLLSPLACGGSAYAYAMAHRAHHIFSDTEKDPHGKYLGFFKTAMFDWNFKKIPIKTAQSLNDKWIVLSHNYYVGIILIFYLILLTIDLQFALVYNLSVIFLWFAYISINVLNHTKGTINYRNYETSDNSQNNLIVGYLVGEWHNNHHHNPQKWNQKEKWWEIDVSAQLVKIIKSRI